MSSDMFEDFLWALDHGHKRARRRNARRGKNKPAVRSPADGKIATSSPAEPLNDCDGIKKDGSVIAAKTGGSNL